ncbi:MAG: A24 family peptidase [Alphaproteobacteria bacterium]|nr:A24 family peptidase [Alphaproteobacteria bacterium]
MTPESLIPLLIAPFVGSFLGVVIDRLPNGEPVLLGRSRCDCCARALRPAELLPLISYACRLGRCGCGETRLRPFHPLIELSALAVALSAVIATAGWLLVVSLYLGWSLLALAVIDQRHFILPDSLTLPLIPMGLAVAWTIDPGRIVPHLLGVIAGFLAFAAIGWLYRNLRGQDGLGLGDAKLLAAAGAWLGWQALPGVVGLASAAGLAIALLHAAGGRPMDGRSAIAFGPYLALALWLVWLAGPVLPS